MLGLPGAQCGRLSIHRPAETGLSNLARSHKRLLIEAPKDNVGNGMIIGRTPREIAFRSDATARHESKPHTIAPAK